MKTHPRLILTVLHLASATTVAGASRADGTCAAPILVQCRDPAYLATACGRAATADETSACTVLLGNAYQTETQKSDVTSEEVMLPGQPGNTTVARTKRYGLFNHFARNDHFTHQFFGFEQKSQLAIGSGGAINLFADGATVLGLSQVQDQRARWTASGNAVQSCTEYAYERFFGYTRFKDLADLSFLDDEALYDKAFDPAQGIANKTLYSKSGAKTLAPIVWPSNGVIGTIIVGGVPQPVVDSRSPKNGFFKAYKSLAKGSFFKPADAALRTKLQQAQSHHVVDWNWHKQMHDTVGAAYDQETLRYFEDMQADFAKLAAEREAVLVLIAKYGPTMTSTDPPATRDLAAELAAVESALRAELATADAEGCLDPVNPSVCDWSFRQFRDQVAAYYSKQMEDAFQRCVDTTGDDFTAGAPVRDAVQYYQQFANGKRDYATTAEDVEAFQGVVTNWVDGQSYPKDPDGKPSIRDSKSDSGTVGSGDLSLDWSYAAGWSIENLTPTGKACAAGLKVNGEFKAVGHAYGTNINVIDAGAELYTEASTGKAKVKLTVLDQKIWNRWDNPYSTELSAGLVKDMKSGTSKEFSTTIYPFGIPVTLGAGVGMSVGLKLNAKASVGGNCNSQPVSTLDLASVSGTVTPWAQADAFGSAAVGIPGFRAGIKCNVVLVRGEMPITANAKITMNRAGFVNASTSLSGKQTFRLLDGKIKAFIDGPWGLDSEWTIFSWQGPKIDQEVFRFEKSTMPLDLMKGGTSS